MALRIVGRSILALVFLFGLSSARAPAKITSDPTGDNWYPDKRFGGTFSLTPDESLVVVQFEPGTNVETRHGIVEAEGLLPHLPYADSADLGVYEVKDPGGAAAIVARLSRVSLIRDAAPAYRDREGFLKVFPRDRVTVRFEPDTPSHEQQRIILSLGAKRLRTHWTPGYHTVSLPEGMSVFEAARAFSALPQVRFSEPDFLSYNDAQGDPLFPDQWALENEGQNMECPCPDADVSAQEAWAMTQGTPGIVVAIIDNGMDLDHEDLTAALMARSGEDWDFSSDAGEEPIGYGSHGTKCAGIIGATQGNQLGLAGLAPGCRLMPLKVNMNASFLSQRVDAINYAASRRAEMEGLVISASWSVSAGDVIAIHDAVADAEDAGCVLLFASGNYIENDPDPSVVYPAKYPETIAVGATNPCDQRIRPGSCDQNLPIGWGSKFGPEVDLVAPGVAITTTVIDQYTTGFAGTSASTPLVAAAAALALSADPSLTPDVVRALMQETSLDQVGDPAEDTPGFDPYMGFGRLDSYGLLLEVVGEVDVKVSLNDGFLLPGGHLDYSASFTNFSRQERTFYPDIDIVLASGQVAMHLLPRAGQTVDPMTLQPGESTQLIGSLRAPRGDNPQFAAVVDRVLRVRGRSLEIVEGGIIDEHAASIMATSFGHTGEFAIRSSDSERDPAGHGHESWYRINEPAHTGDRIAQRFVLPDNLGDLSVLKGVAVSFSLASAGANVDVRILRDNGFGEPDPNQEVISQTILAGSILGGDNLTSVEFPGIIVQSGDILWVVVDYPENGIVELGVDESTPRFETLFESGRDPGLWKRFISGNIVCELKLKLGARAALR